MGKLTAKQIATRNRIVAQRKAREAARKAELRRQEAIRKEAARISAEAKRRAAEKAAQQAAAKRAAEQAAAAAKRAAAALAARKAAQQKAAQQQMQNSGGITSGTPKAPSGAGYGTRAATGSKPVHPAIQASVNKVLGRSAPSGAGYGTRAATAPKRPWVTPTAHPAVQASVAKVLGRPMPPKPQYTTGFTADPGKYVAKPPKPQYTTGFSADPGQYTDRNNPNRYDTRTVREDPSKYVGDNVTKEWQEYRDAQNRKHAEERAQYNATVREDPSKYVGDNVTKEWQEYRDAQNKKHAEERARTVREDPSKYVGDNVTKEWQEYRDEQNRKHAEERARTVRDDPGRYTDWSNPNHYYADTYRDDAGRYTDPNNKNGWYGTFRPREQDTAFIKRVQEMLGLKQTGVWDKATNNAYQIRQGKIKAEKEAKYTSGFSADPGQYTDEYNPKGWYNGSIPAGIDSVETVKAMQKVLGMKQTGKWDRATHNAYQRWLGMGMTKNSQPASWAEVDKILPSDIMKSSSGLVWNGKVYLFDFSQPEGTQFNNQWETVRTYNGDVTNFNWGKMLSGFSLEGYDTNDGRMHIGSNKPGGGTAYYPSPSLGAGVLELALGVGTAALNATEKTFYQITLMERNGNERQAVIQVGTNADRNTKAFLETNRWISSANAAGSGPDKVAVHVKAENVYKQYIGELEKPYWCYDVQFKYSETYTQNEYAGVLKPDGNGNLVYIPYTDGIEVRLVVSGEGTYDLTRYL